MAKKQRKPLGRKALKRTRGGAPVSFNPKDLTIDKPVPWQKHKNTEGDAPTLEFRDKP